VRLPTFNCSAYFLHPAQDAQQSAELQHDAFAAFAAPAKPSAITAISRIALILFMDFSLYGAATRGANIASLLDALRGTQGEFRD